MLQLPSTGGGAAFPPSAISDSSSSSIALFSLLAPPSCVPSPLFTRDPSCVATGQAVNRREQGVGVREGLCARTEASYLRAPWLPAAHQRGSAGLDGRCGSTCALSALLLPLLPPLHQGQERIHLLSLLTRSRLGGFGQGPRTACRVPLGTPPRIAEAPHDPALRLDSGRLLLPVQLWHVRREAVPRGEEGTLLERLTLRRLVLRRLRRGLTLRRARGAAEHRLQGAPAGWTRVSGRVRLRGPS